MADSLKLSAFPSRSLKYLPSYIEELGTTASNPTLKQHLAAIRRLFDYLQATCWR
jgi:hypothetical protein